MRVLRPDAGERNSTSICEPTGRLVTANNPMPPPLIFKPMALTWAEAVNKSTELFHHWRSDFLAGEN